MCRVLGCIVLFPGAPGAGARNSGRQLPCHRRHCAGGQGDDRTALQQSRRQPAIPLAPDHAGIFETTLLAALWPELVQLNRLPSLNNAPLAEDDVWEEGRHDPKHPIWGVVGPDPRNFNVAQAKPLLDATVAWLVDKVRK